MMPINIYDWRIRYVALQHEEFSMNALSPSNIEQLPALKEKATVACNRMGTLAHEISLLTDRLRASADPTSPDYAERERLEKEFKTEEAVYNESINAIKEITSEVRSFARTSDERVQELHQQGQIAMAKIMMATNEISVLDELIGEDKDTSNPHYIERENLRRVRRELQASCDLTLKEMKSLVATNSGVVKELTSLPANTSETSQLPVAKESTTIWWLLGGMAVGAGGMITAIASGALNGILGL